MRLMKLFDVIIPLYVKGHGRIE